MGRPAAAEREHGRSREGTAATALCAIICLCGISDSTSPHGRNRAASRAARSAKSRSVGKTRPQQKGSTAAAEGARPQRRSARSSASAASAIRRPRTAAAERRAERLGRRSPGFMGRPAAAPRRAERLGRRSPGFMGRPAATESRARPQRRSARSSASAESAIQRPRTPTTESGARELPPSRRPSSFSLHPYAGR